MIIMIYVARVIHDYLQMYFEIVEICYNMYELDPAHFLSPLRLSWQSALKNTEIELELLTDNDLLLMVKKRIGGGICHVVHYYAKASNKYMKNYDKNQ